MGKTITTKVTDEEFDAVLDQLSQRVGAVNPKGHGGTSLCVYTDRKGFHCLAGEALVLLGLKCPGARSRDVSTGIRNLPVRNIGRLTDRQIDVLEIAQWRADDGLEWRSAIEIALQFDYGN